MTIMLSSTACLQHPRREDEGPGKRCLIMETDLLKVFYIINAQRQKKIGHEGFEPTNLVSIARCLAVW